MLSTENQRVKNTATKSQIPAYDCASIAARIPAGVKLISFDCFDTILWRQTAEPKDVFYTLCEHPEMKALGMTVALRTMSEAVAYQLNKIKKNQTQATLTEIYQQAFPEANTETINRLVAIEIECEKAACFAYQPMVNLIQTLHQQGYKLIITSDTYFTKPMLTELLSACLPENTLACFNEIYTSCDQGTAKFENLFKHILDRRVIHPGAVCHIGDHPISDYDKPGQIGIHAIQLIQYQAAITEIHRMTGLAAAFIDTNIRQTRPLNLPFKALFAEKLTTPDPATLIGYAVIGPIMLAFAHDIIQTIQAMKTRGKNVKVTYLLRDAYLPSRVTEIINGHALGKDTRISRFTAFAASFRSVEDIDTYLASRLSSARFEEMAKQLCLPEKEINALVKMAKKANQPTEAFNRAIHQPAIVEKILAGSKQYRERLFRYLQHELQLERGDTLVFVDLGYTGTAQNRLAPVFKAEYDITIEGCYLLSLKTPMTSIYKHGLLSPEHYNDNVLTLLVTHIALLEQVCTSTEKTVVDFDEAGQPIYGESQLDQTQIDSIQPIHQACLQFIHDASALPAITRQLATASERRDMAAFTLARLLYLPTKLENDYFTHFKHDVNLGTNDFIALLNPEKSLEDLKRRGWLHSLKVPTQESRMNYPAEWRSISLELAILLMTQYRFDFKVSPSDLTHRQLQVPVIIRINGENNVMPLDANATFDGYYSLIIPAPSNSDIGIAFGESFPCVHIHTMDTLLIHHLYSDHESSKASPALEHMSTHEMQITKEGLLLANNHEGLLLYKAPAQNTLQSVLRIIFKPLS
jgi:FMN phosphatase YigB (HAD superfamily)